jgi:protein-tyrosine phosphatase
MRVLFVCLGNICRSPTAEGVTRQLLAREAPHLGVELDSAGTGDYHVGEPPDPRSQRAALARGIDLGELRARQIRADDFERFDLIIAMDRANLRELVAQRPPRATARLALFMDYAPELGVAEVPDPYQGKAADFERVLDLTEAAARGLITHLERAGADSAAR